MELNNQQIFDNFSQSTLKVFATMCSTVAVPLPSYVKGTQPSFVFDVGGMIGVTTETNRGSIGIYFTEDLYLTLVSRIFGEKVVKIDRTNEDTGAEIMNIIFGDAKVILNTIGHNFRTSIPSIIRGKQITSPNSSKTEVMVYPFNTDAGQFCLEFTLVPLKTEEQVLDKSEGATEKLSEAAFFKPFIDATISTLKTMCTIEANTGKPSAKRNSDAFSFDYGGVIGITSKALCGSYLVGFKKDVFLKIMSRMLGEEFKEIEPGMEDGVAELLNIILGAAKKVLNDDRGQSIQMALPSVVYGSAIRSGMQPGTRADIVIPFYSDIGRFVVEVVISFDAPPGS